MAQMAERDSLRNFRFAYTNIQGTEIAGTVSYTIDGHAYTAPANKLIDAQPIIAGLKSGRHSLQAICGTDTVRHSFVIFTLDDDQLPVDTLDWFYLSAVSATVAPSVFSSVPRLPTSTLSTVSSPAAV